MDEHTQAAPSGTLMARKLDKNKERVLFGAQPKPKSALSAVVIKAPPKAK